MTQHLRVLIAAFLIAALPLQAAAVASMSCHGSQANQAVATNPAIDHPVVANHEHRHGTQAGAHHEHQLHESPSKGAPDHVAGVGGDHQNASATSCAACASCAVFCMLSSAATGSYDCGIVAPGSMAPKAAIADGHADADLGRFLRPPR